MDGVPKLNLVADSAVVALLVEVCFVLWWPIESALGLGFGGGVGGKEKERK